MVREKQVQVLPDLAKRLLHHLGFAAQPLGMLAGHGLQQLLVERVALAGDLGQQGGEADGTAVGVGARTTDGRGHQHGPRQHRGRLAQPLFPGNVCRLVDPALQRREDDLADHEPAISPRDVDQVRVPLAEQVVGPAEHRVRIVVRPQVERQLVEHRHFKVRLAAHRLGERLDDLQHAPHEVGVRAAGDPHVLEEQRHGPKPFVGVRLHPPAVFEHGHGTMADIVVELRDRPLDNPLDGVPGPPLGQGRLADPRDKQRAVEPRLRDMGQQIGVVPPIRRQDLLEHQS